MPDKRRHRGPHPDDRRLFAPGALADLRAAVADLSFLLGRGYAETSALKLVGDRYQLRRRQRDAVMRSACAPDALHSRHARSLPVADAEGASLEIDGYNLLITLESALAGGVVLCGRDGCFRDLASLHGSYRVVEETLPALSLVGETLRGTAPRSVKWYFDSAVSNSGRLAKMLRELATERAWPWSAELVPDPDPLLAASTDTVVSSDSHVLDRCGGWVNLAREIVSSRVTDAWVLWLDDGSA